MTDKLTACPFCGAYAFFVEYADFKFAISCVDCSVITHPSKSKSQAVKLWNRRATIREKGDTFGKKKMLLVNAYAGCNPSHIADELDFLCDKDTPND